MEAINKKILLLTLLVTMLLTGLKPLQRDWAVRSWTSRIVLSPAVMVHSRDVPRWICETDKTDDDNPVGRVLPRSLKHLVKREYFLDKTFVQRKIISQKYFMKPLGRHACASVPH